MNQIEIEHRAQLSPEEYEKLISFLHENGEDLGEDDKSINFFVHPDKLIKVVDSISQDKAKISFKGTKIGKGSDFEEVEIDIPRSEVFKAVRIFQSAGGQHIYEPLIKRHNFMYKGVEFAVKYTPGSWEYHTELKIIISDQNEKEAAEKQIEAVAQELGIQIMTQDELFAFTSKIEADYAAKQAAGNTGN